MASRKLKAFLKRDIVIRKGELKSVYDIENEESLLMDALSAPTNRDGHLEGITATIQKEQNEIIRLNPKRLVHREWMCRKWEDNDFTTTHCVLDVPSKRQAYERYAPVVA